MDKNECTILVDIDDTIEYLCKAWVKWLNKQYGTSVKYEDITEWDISSFFPTLSKDQVFYPLHQPEFWEFVEPMPDAVEYLKKLIDDGFQLYLCTTTDYRNVKPKYEYIIKRYFPYIDWHHIIVTSNKQMVNADILVDDGIHNLEGGKYHGILFTAPHNKNYDAERGGFQRVNNWAEAYNTILEYTTRKGFDLY